MSADAKPLPKEVRSRWFYSAASFLLLVLTLIGFRHFYLHLQAYPGRPLPARPLFILHGVSMTAWMVLAVLQPLLVATGRKRVHMEVGKVAAVLAAGILVTGYLIAIGATRGTPPDLVRFGLAVKEFLVVPLSGILTFGLFVSVGVLKRRRPEVHRPAMLLAAVAAALGRIPVLNSWYAGTVLEHLLSAFGSMLVLGGLMLVVKCALEKRFDRWFAGGLAVLLAICVAASVFAKTVAWERVAAFLLG